MEKSLLDLANEAPVIGGIIQLSDEFVERLNECASIDDLPPTFRRSQIHQALELKTRDETGRYAVATHRISKGEVVGNYCGLRVSKTFKYSLQVDDNVHVIGTGAFDHSCTNPLLFFDETGICSRALRDIAPGEEVTFNYLTTEYEMGSPFQCSCREEGCFGLVKGFKFLTKIQKEDLRDKFPVARHLLRYI